MAALSAVVPKQLLNMAAILGTVAVVDKTVSNSEVYSTFHEQARLGLHKGELALGDTVCTLRDGYIVAGSTVCALK